MWHFFECHPPFFSPCKNRVTFKNVNRSIDQSDYRKLTWGIIIFYISTTCAEGTYIAKLYSLIRVFHSVSRASIFSVLKLIVKVILYAYYAIPFGFSLFLALLGHHFSTFQLRCLAKNHVLGFSTQHAHIPILSMEFNLKWCMHLSRKPFLYL